MSRFEIEPCLEELFVTYCAGVRSRERLCQMQMLLVDQYSAVLLLASALETLESMLEALCEDPKNGVIREQIRSYIAENAAIARVEGRRARTVKRIIKRTVRLGMHPKRGAARRKQAELLVGEYFATGNASDFVRKITALRDTGSIPAPLRIVKGAATG